MKKDLIGICGLFCGACDNYKAFTPEGNHLLETDKFKGQDLDRLKCSGCNSDSLSEHCSKCEMMKCAKNKGLTYCGQCSDYPCDRIESFIALGKQFTGARHRLDITDNTLAIIQKGVPSWLEENQKKWSCSCGQHYTYYETHCVRCHRKLDSYAKKTT